MALNPWKSWREQLHVSGKQALNRPRRLWLYSSPDISDNAMLAHMLDNEVIVIVTIAVLRGNEELRPARTAAPTEHRPLITSTPPGRSTLPWTLPRQCTTSSKTACADRL